MKSAEWKRNTTGHHARREAHSLHRMVRVCHNSRAATAARSIFAPSARIPIDRSTGRKPRHRDARPSRAPVRRQGARLKTRPLIFRTGRRRRRAFQMRAVRMLRVTPAEKINRLARPNTFAARPASPGIFRKHGFHATPFSICSQPRGAAGAGAGDGTAGNAGLNSRPVEK